MYQRMGDATLKNGETVEIGVITAPFDEFADRLTRLLGHKGWEWVWQVKRCLNGKVDDLETRFYVARRGDALVSNTCTFEQQGVGILGHVYTPPEERRKGLATALFERIMPDIRARGIKLMLLGTDYDTPPYYIYKKFGFEGYFEGSDQMRWAAEPDFERKYFAKAPTKIVAPTWAQWPRVNALFGQPEEFPKSFAYGKFGKDHAEDCYIYLQYSLRIKPLATAKLLQSEKTGAIVGVAWIVPRQLFPKTRTLDLYCHPNHTDGWAKLLAVMEWPAMPVVTMIEAGKRAKAAVLKEFGFEPVGMVQGMLPKPDGKVASVQVLVRRPK